jgi:hypothetical protein
MEMDVNFIFTVSLIFKGCLVSKFQKSAEKGNKKISDNFVGVSKQRRMLC